MLRYEELLIKDLRPRHNSLMTGYCRSGRHLLAEAGKPNTNGIVCGACSTEWHRQHYLANREQYLAAASEHYQANRDKILEGRRSPESRARANAYRRTPEWRAKTRAYESRPEVRARRAAQRRERQAREKNPI
jgi:hypothetical protein